MDRKALITNIEKKEEKKEKNSSSFL